MAAKSDEKKTAGEDKSKTTQTTKQAENDDVNDSVEERGDTDAKAAASGSSVGAVKDGDAGLEDAYDDEDGEFPVDGDGVDGALGTVAERNADGDEYDVPYTLLTAEVLPRTSDSDDPAKDWTAQHATGERQTGKKDSDKDPVALVPVQGTPGQTFRVRELPNRDVVEAAGIDYNQWVAGLPVRADVENEAPRRGVPA